MFSDRKHLRSSIRFSALDLCRAPPSKAEFCDQAAGEACPVWPRRPPIAYWGIEDPAAVVGTGIDRERAFVTALRYLKTRISLFAVLPLKSFDEMTLRSRLAEIGQAEGASHKRPDVA